jgi:hypothetical protein
MEIDAEVRIKAIEEGVDSEEIVYSQFILGYGS